MYASTLRQSASQPSRAYEDAVDQDVLRRALATAFASAETHTTPFLHWLLQTVFPASVAVGLHSLPVPPTSVVDETYGKRDSHNSLRNFFHPEAQAQYPVISAVCEAFQSPAVTRTIESLCGIDLKGSSLRIEYCQDGDGFWLEPHIDIPVKRITIQLHLSVGPGSDALGTTLYNADRSFCRNAPGDFNCGMIFLPKTPESWHGFEKRTMQTLRKSLIVNYVEPEWRARHELAFPRQPIE